MLLPLSGVPAALQALARIAGLPEGEQGPDRWIPTLLVLLALLARRSDRRAERDHDAELGA